jgi:spermidine/putrescine transport system permease protein
MSTIYSSRGLAKWGYGSQIVVLALLFFGALANIALLSIGTGPSSMGGAAPTLAFYTDILVSPRIRGAFAISLQLAAVTALIAVPLALVTARANLALKSPIARLLVGGIIMLPLLSSSVLRMLGFSMILSDNGPLNWLTCKMSNTEFCAGLLYSPPAIVVGLVSSLLPICTLIFFIQLLRIPAEEIMAAQNLGASAWDIWWRIEIPRCRSALVISAQLCIMFVLGDMLTQSILGGNTIYTYAAAMNDRMKIDEWSAAAAMAVLLILIVCSLIATVVWLMQRPTDSARRRLTHLRN